MAEYRHVLHSSIAKLCITQTREFLVSSLVLGGLSFVAFFLTVDLADCYNARILLLLACLVCILTSIINSSWLYIMRFTSYLMKIEDGLAKLSEKREQAAFLRRKRTFEVGQVFVAFAQLLFAFALALDLVALLLFSICLLPTDYLIVGVTFASVVLGVFFCMFAITIFCLWNLPRVRWFYD